MGKRRRDDGEPRVSEGGTTPTAMDPGCAEFFRTAGSKEAMLIGKVAIKQSNKKYACVWPLRWNGNAHETNHNEVYMINRMRIEKTVWLAWCEHEDWNGSSKIRVILFSRSETRKCGNDPNLLLESSAIQLSGVCYDDELPYFQVMYEKHMRTTGLGFMSCGRNPPVTLLGQIEECTDSEQYKGTLRVVEGSSTVSCLPGRSKFDPRGILFASGAVIQTNQQFATMFDTICNTIPVVFKDALGTSRMAKEIHNTMVAANTEGKRGTTFVMVHPFHEKDNVVATLETSIHSFMGSNEEVYLNNIDPEHYWVSAKQFDIQDKGTLMPQFDAAGSLYCVLSTLLMKTRAAASRRGHDSLTIVLFAAQLLHLVTAHHVLQAILEEMNRQAWEDGTPICKLELHVFIDSRDYIDGLFTGRPFIDAMYRSDGAKRTMRKTYLDTIPTENASERSRSLWALKVGGGHWGGHISSIYHKVMWYSDAVALRASHPSLYEHAQNRTPDPNTGLKLPLILRDNNDIKRNRSVAFTDIQRESLPYCVLLGVGTITGDVILFINNPNSSPYRHKDRFTQLMYSIISRVSEHSHVYVICPISEIGRSLPTESDWARRNVSFQPTRCDN